MSAEKAAIEGIGGVRMDAIEFYEPYIGPDGEPPPAESEEPIGFVVEISAAIDEEGMTTLDIYGPEEGRVRRFAIPAGGRFHR